MSLFNWALPFGIFRHPSPAALKLLVAKAVADYTVTDGKVWFKQHFPEKGTRQQFKRAVLDHVAYCGPTYYEYGTGTTAIFGALPTAGVYVPADIITANGTQTCEVIEAAQEATLAGLAGDGAEERIQAGGAARR